MVSREYCECSTCKLKMILRVGIGVEPSHTHFFDCPSCGTPSSITVKSHPPGASIGGLENISMIPQNTEAGHIINLHPSFAFKSEEYKSPVAFASMIISDLISDHLRSPASERIKDVALNFEVPETEAVWATVRNVITLSTKNDPANILEKQVSKYESQRAKYKPKFKCETKYKCIASFFDDAFYPAIGNLRSPLRAFIKRIKNEFPTEFEKLREYHQSELQKTHVDLYLSILTDYFRNFSHYRQILAHARVNDEDVDDLIIGSKSFDQIKLYYGQAYETLTSLYTILAAIFNIGEGRSFDQFQQMTLKKYISDVEKAKKSRPFSQIPELSAFSKFEDSALRNGSHHASIWREGDSIKYRSGGTGAQRDISYSRYLHMCNAITIAISALMLVEFEFFGPTRIS